LQIMGEVLALARKRGLDPRQLLAVLTGSMFGSRVHKLYGDKIAQRLYTSGGFIFPLALKDVRLALAEAEAGRRAHAVSERAARPPDRGHSPRLFRTRLVGARPAGRGGSRTGSRNDGASLSSGQTLAGRAASRDLLPVDRHEPVSQRLHETYERVLL